MTGYSEAALETCNRARRECHVTQATGVVPDVNDSAKDYWLNVDLQTYSIASWDSGEVVAHDKGLCYRSILTINSNSKEVFEMVRNHRTKVCREAPWSPPPLEKPRIARLVPGWDRTRKWGGRTARRKSAPTSILGI